MLRNNRTRIWRRVAALWIDSLFVYALAVTVLRVAGAVSLRIPVEPLFVALAAAYGSIMIAWRQGTVGKVLLGLRVTHTVTEHPGLGSSVLREVFGKWLLLVVFPVILGRVVVGRAWIPTIFELVVVALVGILLAFSWIWKSATPWDLVARTEVVRVYQAGHKTIMRMLLCLIAVTLLGSGVEVGPLFWHRPIESTFALFRDSRPLAGYSSFLKEKHPGPKDYIFDLFNQHDIVVVCERYHEEQTQWQFISDLVEDPRFTERVGHVFTEYGNAKVQPFLDSFMTSPCLSEPEIAAKSIHIMRNFTIWPAWDIRSFYDYLGRLYRLNHSLSPALQVKHYFCDDEPLWGDIRTQQDFKDLLRTIVPLRDRTMAKNIILQFHSIQRDQDPRRKALVIMNYRHAFGLVNRDSNQTFDNTTAYLIQAFPGKVANVLLNTNILVVVPIQSGSWDAAFAARGNTPMGFSFAGSPFGSDGFDLFPFNPSLKGSYTYSDAFTGYVFLNALDDQSRAPMIPHFFDGFEAEALRRAKISERMEANVAAAIELDKAGWEQPPRDMPHAIIQTILQIGTLGVLLIGLPVAATSAYARTHEPANSA
jgi:hypothetical protein